MQLIYGKHTERYAKRMAEGHKNRDIVIGVGGGSVIDAAKLAAKPRRCIAVPTTASGSACTSFAVIWLKDRKISVDTPIPMLKEYKGRINLPANVRQSTMFDCLSHAFESLWSNNATNKSRRYALNAIKKASTIKNDNDLVEAGNIAGKAINITRTNIVHAMSYPLTLRCGIDHGTACAILLPHVMEYMDASESAINDVKSLYASPLPKIKICPAAIASDAMSYEQINDTSVRIHKKDVVKILEEANRCLK